MFPQKTYLIIIILSLIHLTWLPSPSFSASIHKTIGIYGVPSTTTQVGSTIIDQLKKHAVTAVFAQPDEHQLKQLKNSGFQVFLTLNAFGGKQAWTLFADSIPVSPDNQDFITQHGGICPTHPGWRKNRLSLVKEWLTKYGETGLIDSIWLDFIRYPGLWEIPQPEIPDTCYCNRCLTKFQHDMNVSLPNGLTAELAAQWIHANAPCKWMSWKKEQINSFAREVKQLINNHPGTRHLVLGLFLVPWTKGEQHNAISGLLSQDAGKLGTIADIVSPMLYHEMCGRSLPWIKKTTEYFRDAANCPVWPIIQAEDLNADQFSQAIGYVAQGGANGLLVYTFKSLTDALWRQLPKFTPQKKSYPKSRL